MILLLSSCGLDQTGLDKHSDSDGVWKGPSFGKHMSGTWYAAALDYSEGYDWRADSDDGLTQCSIVMFADGVPVLKVPAGASCEVPVDPGRLRIRAGHLYTDYTDGTVTVIKKDGEEILRYEGAEEVVSLEVVDGTVHMLCVPRTGDGFVYRTGCSASVTRDTGTLYGDLTVHEGAVCFCFTTGSKHYMAVDGKVSRIEMDSDVSEVLDMCMLDGAPCIIARMNGAGAPVMLRSGKRESIDYFGFIDVASCRFLMTESLCVRVRSRHENLNAYTDILWFGDNRWAMPRFFSSLVSVVADGKGYHAVSNPSEYQSGGIFSYRNEYELPEDCHVYGEGCAVVRDSILYVGLTSGKGLKPVIWKNGLLDTLDVNGPVICLR